MSDPILDKLDAILGEHRIEPWDITGMGRSGLDKNKALLVEKLRELLAEVAIEYIDHEALPKNPADVVQRIADARKRFGVAPPSEAEKTDV